MNRGNLKRTFQNSKPDNSNFPRGRGQTIAVGVNMSSN